MSVIHTHYTLAAAVYSREHAYGVLCSRSILILFFSINYILLGFFSIILSPQIPKCMAGLEKCFTTKKRIQRKITHPPTPSPLSPPASNVAHAGTHR